MPATEKRPSRLSPRRPDLALWVLLALGLVVVALTSRHYGATWDEGVQARYGELSLRYFATAGADTACNSFLDLRFYGPLVEMVPAMIYDAGRPGKYDIRHLLLGLTALLSIPAAWLYGRLFRATGMAVFSVLAVVTIPRFYGHWFNNSKDMPFAVMVLWYMYTLGALFAGPSVRWRRAIACGVAMGLALCVRPGGLPLLVLFLGGAALAWLSTRPEAPAGVEPQTAWSRIVKLAAVPAIAWLIMVAPWPWAHQNPLGHPIEAMRVATRFATTMPILFEGVTTQSDQLPWYYMSKYVLIGTPLTTLGLALIGLIFGVKSQVADWRSPRSRLTALTQMWFFAPLILFALARPNVYGGMRHFVFVLPALGILAASGATALLGLVKDPRRRAIAWLVLGAVLLLPVKDLVRLHPYQTTYYNALVGGLQGASESYWTDYYLSSYAEAIEWVNDQAARTPGRTVQAVIAAGPPVMLWARDYAAENVELRSLRTLGGSAQSEGAQSEDPKAEFYIGTTRRDMDRVFPESPVVHSIGRDGATFTVVKRLGTE